MTIAHERQAGPCASCGTYSDNLLTVAPLLGPDVTSTPADWVCWPCYKACAEVGDRLRAAGVIDSVDPQAAAKAVVTAFLTEPKCVCCGGSLN